MSADHIFLALLWVGCMAVIFAVAAFVADKIAQRQERR